MKLEDQIRDTMRFKHLSLKTEESYVGWYRRYVLWHGKKHPAEMGAAESCTSARNALADQQMADTKARPAEHVPRHLVEAKPLGESCIWSDRLLRSQTASSPRVVYCRSARSLAFTVCSCPP